MPFAKTEDLRLKPAYSVAEAARYLRLPPETLRSWVIGRSYPVGGRSRHFQPLIRLSDSKQPFLSFINLVEAHILAAIRKLHRIKLSNVRSALDYVEQKFAVAHPLIEQEFQTDGLDLFIEQFGEVINTSRGGQRVMKDIMGVYLKRIERDAKGLPIKLFPFTRVNAGVASPVSGPRIVVISPSVSFGRPVINGTGIPVSSIFERYQAGDSVADLALDFAVDVSAVEEAIRCEAA